MTKHETPPSTTNPEHRSQFEYVILANPYERMNYVHLTDELIAKMDGTDGDRPDFVIFLDRSARPVNWLVRELWDTLAAKDGDGNVPQRPQSLFVNIDARSHRDSSVEALASLRSIYSIDPPAEGLDMMHTPTYLDGKNVLVVDEVAVSGDTIRAADQYLSKAFPSANIRTHAWMSATPDRPDLPATNNPRWYEKGSDRFRSVQEGATQEKAVRLKASDPRIKRGWDWIAKIPDQQEDGTKQLAREIAAFADDVKNGTLPYIPAYARPDEEERIRAFSGLEPADFYSFVRWTKQYYWPGYNIAATVTDKTGPLSEDVAKEFARLNHITNARRLGNRRPGRFEYVVDPRTPDARMYSERVGLAQSATAALARQIKTVR